MIVDPASIETAKQLDEPEFEVLLYEFKADLNAYLAALGPDRAGALAGGNHRLQRSPPGKVMPYFGQEIMVMAQERGPLTDEKYLRALADCRRLARDEGIDATLARQASTPSSRRPAVPRG